jgi:hypothetical protein
VLKNSNVKKSKGSIMQCISCGKTLNSNLCKIGEQFPSAIYNDDDNNKGAVKSTSLDLAICSNQDCKLVQLNEIVNLDYVYSHYPYQTSTTATMSLLLKEFADQSLSKYVLLNGDVVLDIGGNDGTLLSFFSGTGSKLVNIDIASGIQQVFNDANYTYINAKFSKLEYDKTKLKAPKFIFSSAVFYQLSDPNTFCSDLWNLMDDESIFFLQMTYLGTMYKNNVYDNVVHEHLAYYSLFSLESLLTRHKFKLVEISINEVYGGSMRATIVKESSRIKVNLENLNNLRDLEKLNKVNEEKSLLNFATNFNQWKHAAKKLLGDLIEKHKFVVGLGASTKGNMLLQALQIDKQSMNYIIDNNEKKIGTWTSGSLIPIVDESYLTKPHRAIFLLPYYYLDFFQSLLKRSIPTGDHVDLFIPLPYPKVIKVWGVA